MRHFLFLIVFFAVSSVKADEVAVHKEVQWVTDSVEYAAICAQTFRGAFAAVKGAVAEEKGPWAVVLDLDETVLDNSTYQIERYAQGLGYTPDSWGKWVEREEAVLVPGAREFLDKVKALPGGKIVYITDRKAERDAHTIANLKKFGLYDGKTHLLLARKDKPDNKEIRRACVVSGKERCEGIGPRRIVALIGDSVRDMIELHGTENAAKARAEAAADDSPWGVLYFQLPNPMYGSWERGYK
ncbi:MAG: hypothetical protein AUJ52_04695 [Elusimicrobia bacterium CG1_02_63_36]|nr:MAG: hypothetical protein AUJ52_04695 [Elusimicrobia bacterium CG1_02_63_36]PIP83047.1 MAG: hypothetical protein COR54_11680 [Elusimicrobia bacterium CG22_combo_CG10-13_8_21_14_all_63_91]PJA14176.1 MAG: hypothetical protein COX66_13250 [Elusimicrobia bacterium CG_4_10_14_0_2_um_filter_63_34]PJB24428.1 MAG: hypothetical protein CO113_13980 [Elusimicrobia bacterium CG_4_9_14_3_um_filter_62_55]